MSQRLHCIYNQLLYLFATMALLAVATGAAQDFNLANNYDITSLQQNINEVTLTDKNTEPVFSYNNNLP